MSPHRIASILAHATALTLAHDVHAQTGACDLLKAKLSARIDPSIRNFSMEAVPADTPVPPGAKVIGTCESGARKLLFRKGTAAQALADSDAKPAPDVAPVARAASASAAARAPLLPGPAPTPAPKRGGVELMTVALPPATDPVEAARPIEPVKVEPTVPLSPASIPVTPGTAAMQPSSAGVLARYWTWILAPALMVLAGVLWAWISHRMAYDAAGLPRGPRLN